MRQDNADHQKAELAKLGIEQKKIDFKRKQAEFGGYGSQDQPLFPNSDTVLIIKNPKVVAELKEAARAGVDVTNFIGTWRAYKLTIDLPGNNQFHVVPTKGSGNANTSEGNYVGLYFNNGHVLNTREPQSFFVELDLWIARQYGKDFLRSQGYTYIDTLLRDTGVDYSIYLVMLAEGFDPSLDAANTNYFRIMTREETRKAFRFEFSRNLQRHYTDNRLTALTSGSATRMALTDVERISLERKERAAYKKIANALKTLSQQGNVVLVDPNLQGQDRYTSAPPIMSVAEYEAFMKNEASRRTLVRIHGEIDGVSVPQELAEAVRYVNSSACALIMEQLLK